MRGSAALASSLGAAVLACQLSGCAGGNSGARNQGAAGSNGGASGGAASGGGSVGGSATGGGPSGGGSPQAGSGGSAIAVPDEDAPGRELTYEPSNELILNPERGFYATTELVDAPNLTGLRASGVTLAHSYVRLDDYRTSDIPQSLLTQAGAGFEKARQAGVKVVLRFAYNFGPYPNPEPDAPLSWVLEHIGQLQPLLEQNADVIAVVQGGFVGAWGEWHSSTNALTEPAARQAILEGLLDALPVTRSVQLRYPPYKHELYGGALTEANAFDNSYAARLGHHNDCFVSSDTDVGTYPDNMVDFYRDYVGDDTAFVPMGGETCAVSAPRSECASALAEMQKLHVSYLNREYEPDVLASWADCRDEIERKLGYRLVLKSAKLPALVKPGGSFTLQVELDNVGFAAPFNPRPVFVVLRGNGVAERVQLQKAEVRRWLLGGSIAARLRLPAPLAAGSYQVSLWLPDAAESLQGQSEYALRFANAETWDDASGENLLGELEVSDAAPGTSVADATFSVLAE